jgi:probable rRNA maturation factor
MRSKPEPPILFHFLVPCTLTNRRLLRQFLASIFKKEKQRLEGLNIIFCSDDYLLALNRQFLKHDFYTDILSFPLSKPGQPLNAEIYISLDRVRDNAKNLESTFREELHRVIFHGVLHFCGFKDKSTREIKTMRGMEDKYLRSYFRKTPP